MPYNGFLLKVGEYTLPHKEFMQIGTFESYINVQDIDSYVDANGELHRNALEHVRGKVEFTTQPFLTGEQMHRLLEGISDNYVKKIERKAIVTRFVPEINDYVTEYMYLAGPKPLIHDIWGGVVIYKPLRLSFIGY